MWNVSALATGCPRSQKPNAERFLREVVWADRARRAVCSEDVQRSRGSSPRWPPGNPQAWLVTNTTQTAPRGHFPPSSPTGRNFWSRATWSTHVEGVPTHSALEWAAVTTLYMLTSHSVPLSASLAVYWYCLLPPLILSHILSSYFIYPNKFLKSPQIDRATPALNRPTDSAGPHRLVDLLLFAAHGKKGNENVRSCNRRPGRHPNLRPRDGPVHARRFRPVRSVRYPYSPGRTFSIPPPMGRGVLQSLASGSDPAVSVGVVVRPRRRPPHDHVYVQHIPKKGPRTVVKTQVVIRRKLTVSIKFKVVSAGRL